jgi:hypothetical protein
MKAVAMSALCHKPTFRLYSITSSARPNSEGDTVRPNAFAVTLLGGAIAVLVAATALTLKITQPKVTLPRAALVASAQPVDPTILHAHRQRWRDEMPRP